MMNGERNMEERNNLKNSEPIVEQEKSPDLSPQEPEKIGLEFYRDLIIENEGV